MAVVKNPNFDNRATLNGSAGRRFVDDEKVLKVDDWVECRDITLTVVSVSRLTDMRVSKLL